MDDRLQKALEFANYRATLQQQRENLKLRFADMLVFAQNGGTFRIDPELICLTHILKERQEKIVLLDVNENPILIENIGAFHEAIVERYNEVLNEYHYSYENLRQARTVKKATGW